MEKKTDFDLLNFIKRNKKYSNIWEFQKTDNTFIQEVLNKASKNKKGNKGYPDLIYTNENKKLIILVENKSSIKNHISKDGKSQPQLFAVDGIKHYLFFFTSKNLLKQKEIIQRYLRNWKIIGWAFSGDINNPYNHILQTFVIENNEIIDINENTILDEQDYIFYFQNIDLEKIAIDLSKSSKIINNLLRNIDSQKRPILVSALMICLYPSQNFFDFRNNYQSYQPNTIVTNIPNTIRQILKQEGIDDNKINVLINELAFLKTDKDLITTNIIKNILKELEDNVIPLFNKNTTYDIIGKFYKEFLRYAGVADVKKGIVLTPNHITELFSDLIDFKIDDVILDPACGTGAFLIASLNKLIQIIEDSNLNNKKSIINNIRTHQLIGIEKSTTMFTLALSNMLFIGDGKSQIFNADFFSQEVDDILNNLNRKPTIGFINPPFGGTDNKQNPTKKEIQFLEKLLDNCSRYVIIIAPLSTFFKDDHIRTRIFTKHRLKYVINMPSEIFHPNASAYTAIAVFETNIPQTQKDKVVFYSLTDDGFKLSKNKGRTDPYNNWSLIKKDLLKKIKNPMQYEDQINLVYKSLMKNDEWIIQAHSKIDYSQLWEEDFIKTIREYVIFQTKKNLNLLNEQIDELKLFEIFKQNQIQNKSVVETTKIKTSNQISLHAFGASAPVYLEKNWKEFKIADLFNVLRGERLVEIERIVGDIPLITSSSYNNGIVSYICFDLFKNKKKLFQNKITIDAFGNVFYHSYNYFSNDNVHTLLLKEKNKLNIYTNLFLVTILKKLKARYSFGRQVRLQRLEKEIIQLPANSKGEPDWQFMETFIKSLPYSSNL